MEWISVKDGLPEELTKVIVCYNDKYRKSVVTLAQYVLPRSIPFIDFMDENYCDIEYSDYDEENDIYWTVSGWYEDNTEVDTNWYLHGDVTHWMPLPEPLNEIGYDTSEETEDDYYENDNWVHDSDMECRG